MENFEEKKLKSEKSQKVVLNKNQSRKLVLYIVHCTSIGKE